MTPHFISVCRLLVFIALVALGPLTGWAQISPPDADDAKTSVEFPDEPFVQFAPGVDGVRYVKFHILLSAPGTAHFQDTTEFPFHYDFATARLTALLGFTRPQYEAVSLRLSGQQVVAGTVLFGPHGTREIGVQFTGLEPYAKENITRLF